MVGASMSGPLKDGGFEMVSGPDGMTLLVEDKDRVSRTHFGHALELVEDDVAERRDVGHADQ